MTATTKNAKSQIATAANLLPQEICDEVLLEKYAKGNEQNISDVRLRVALNHTDKPSAERLGREVTALYTCGPAGGGGVRTALRQRLGTVSCTVPREQVPASFRFIEAAP